MTLTLKRKPVTNQLATCRLDLYGIVPDRVLELDVASVGQLTIKVDDHVTPLQEQFEIVDGPRDALLLTGDLSKADRVGGGLQSGMMTVESDVGLGLAEGMKQGQLIIHGNAGDYACSQLRGGQVRIEGHVGDYCGASPKGLRSGMRGGSCTITGNAGRFLAYRMRRGTLLVCGHVGEGSASSMIAGSLIIAGKVTGPMGVAMRRGSIVLFCAQEPELPVGFTPLEPVKLSFMPLLLNQVAVDLPRECLRDLQDGTWQRSLGDRASGGMGEVLWLRPKDEELLQ